LYRIEAARDMEAASFVVEKIKGESASKPVLYSIVFHWRALGMKAETRPT